ncbi:hypothetical protein F0562_001994 [Nyssa sinensis]|uniref:BHLH domain-containing protein n=1 Tax=Nyssa sinensis TaxID=561372 RepID=A0A5J5C8J1_9ASTE|nr:hypothetical protein F0562_001994 [Nyssa sinensis]
MERRDASENPLEHVSDFSLMHNVMDEMNFEQFIDINRGEISTDPNIVKFCSNYDCEHIGGSLIDNDDQFGPIPGDLFGFNSAAMCINPNTILSSLPGIDDDVKGAGEEENNVEESSATTTTTTTTTTVLTKRTKVDGSRTLISERRRRGRMEEALFALRSLVPNISKMDKASIVGDAVLYVQELQMQAKKLKAEIAELESPLLGVKRYQGRQVENPKKIQLINENHSVFKNIIQMDVFQVEEREFYVRLVCNKGQGVAASLYRALESLSSFNVQSSNLATIAERFILTLTLNVRECEVDMNLSNLKLWVTGALLNQGFEFRIQPCT